MNQQQTSLLTEAIYDAAVDPGGWAQVMALLKENLRTGAETFYFLDYNRGTMKPIFIGGIADFYFQCFEDRFFTEDNPCIHAEPLHRPGVVRTDERLAAYFGDRNILRRSQYYNDWMRPQELDHSMGTTVLAERGVVANLSLLRSADIGSFRADELQSFVRICRHLRRAIRMAMRLETVAAQSNTALEALDCLPYGAIFLDLQGRLLSCNAIAETLLRTGDGLSLRGGRLVAVDNSEQRKLGPYLQQFAGDQAAGDESGAANIAIYRASHPDPLILSAIRLSAHQRTFVSAQATILLLIAEPALARPRDIELVRRRYRFTPAEARLAQALLAGNSLKQAAESAGTTYETARWYLKILFQKTDTNRQAELVARLLNDMAVPAPTLGRARENAGLALTRE